MGWDAYCYPIDHNHFEGPGHPDFEARARQLMAKGYMVDALLSYGALDHSLCGKMLQKATGEMVWGGNWDVEKVQVLRKTADWNFKLDKASEEWARQSARAFLEVAARLGLAIRFSV